MDDTQRIVKCGNLTLHTAGGFFKKKWHSKYLVLYDGSKSGIKRLELFDSEIKFKKQNAAKIIPLVDCVRVVTCQRNKTTYTFEVRTSEQFYLLAAQSFQDMNDWVNCLRLVAFGEATGGKQQQQGFTAVSQPSFPPQTPKRLQQQQRKQTSGEKPTIDVLLDKRNIQSLAPTSSNQLAGVQFNPSGGQQPTAAASKITTASQAMTAASSALAKTRQRQPSLLGSCKPQPPTDSPFIQQQQEQPPAEPHTRLNAIGDQIDTLTPTVRGQLIGVVTGSGHNANQTNSFDQQSSSEAEAATAAAPARQLTQQQQPARTQGRTTQAQRVANTIQATLDEEEENMLYCSIEDNPSEHNYRVKVIESELSLRCQLKCYQLTTPNTVSQQYDQIGNFKPGSGAYQSSSAAPPVNTGAPVIFYQLIIGPQELTLLNDYALGGSQSTNKQQQGLWSWPYQCIRRYGFDKDNCFMFEAGRKCTSGPGQFIVQTPKAYSIYQDVVKFVNELRCVSGGGPADQPTSHPSTGSGGVTATSQQDITQANSAITQIPVSWAPECLDSRKHFFDSLRQIGSQSQLCQPQQHQLNNGQNNNRVNNTSNSSINSSTLNNSPVAQRSQQNYPHPHILMSRSPATIPELCEHTSSSSTSSSLSASTSSSSPSSSSSSLTKKSSTKDSVEPPSSKRPTSSDVTSEETDESGYEQGDDSVDSSSSRCRSLAVDLKARQSMSSASSTTSSSGSGGSSVPLYSVIQRPKPARESIESVAIKQQPPPLSRRWPPLKSPEVKQRHDIMNTTMRTSNTEKLLSRLIADSGPTNGQQEQDFEANLIRDVYSEITKLHATFAVTPFSE